MPALRTSWSLRLAYPAQAVPPPVQSFTLTNGSDTVISGQNTVQTTTPGVLVISQRRRSLRHRHQCAAERPVRQSADIDRPATSSISPPASAAPTLSMPSSTAATSSPAMTIKGVQTWNITQDRSWPLRSLIEGTPGYDRRRDDAELQRQRFQRQTTSRSASLGMESTPPLPPTASTWASQIPERTSNAIVFFARSRLTRRRRCHQCERRMRLAIPRRHQHQLVTSTFIEAGSGRRPAASPPGT